ncbi:MAG: hypothetical protein GF421_06925 [Candidatus Aminicenantes bacterium]|nr:hypothetical protein [Candidatus Aminicenantes bacterium]
MKTAPVDPGCSFKQKVFSVQFVAGFINDLISSFTPSPVVLCSSSYWISPRTNRDAERSTALYGQVKN